MGLEMHLIFPYLGTAAMLILSMMATGQLVWEFFDPSERYRETWISRASDYTVSVAYTGTLLSIPSIYYDGWKAGNPGPNASCTAQVLIYTLALIMSAIAWRVSARLAVRIWRETQGLPVMYRGFWALGAFFCPLLVLDAFYAWRKSSDVLSENLNR
jgi:hypothetical protein